MSSRVAPAEEEGARATAERGGGEVGRAFRVSLFSHLRFLSAFAEWEAQNVEVKELSQMYPFFKPMMLAIASRIAVDSNVGMKYRLALATWLTYMDVTSDFYMMRQYFLLGRMGTFVVCLVIMVVHMVMQLLICHLQNRKDKKYMAKGDGVHLSFR